MWIHPVRRPGFLRFQPESRPQALIDNLFQASAKPGFLTDAFSHIRIDGKRGPHLVNHESGSFDVKTSEGIRDKESGTGNLVQERIQEKLVIVDEEKVSYGL